MADAGRRIFVSQLTAGAGLVVLGACNGAAPGAAPGVPSARPPPVAPRAVPVPALEATLQGSVLALHYRYGHELAIRFAGAPWAATLIVSVHPPSAAPACASLAKAAQRTTAPNLEHGVWRAAAEVDLHGLFGLQPPFVRYIHASFLHLRSDVLRWESL